MMSDFIVLLLAMVCVLPEKLHTVVTPTRDSYSVIWDTHLNKLNKCSQNKKPTTGHILPGWLEQQKWATAYKPAVRLYNGFFEKTGSWGQSKIS